MSSISEATATLNATSAASAADPGPLVQYIVVRKDMKWPTGATVAQGCHASTAALWLSRDSPDTIAYASDLDNMYKVVLGTEGDAALRAASTALSEAGITHKLWIEQPEGIVTALAAAPARKSVIQPFFSAFKLLR
jgi:peptidyl-tRNA hydrolase